MRWRWSRLAFAVVLPDRWVVNKHHTINYIEFGVTDMAAAAKRDERHHAELPRGLSNADCSPSFEVAVFGHPGGTETPMEFPTELMAGALLDIDPEIVLCTGDLVLEATPRAMRDVASNVSLFAC